MKRITRAILLTACTALLLHPPRAVAAGYSDQYDFTLTPTPPPTPAMKYQLLYENFADRTAGNAAILYLQSTLLLDADTTDKVDKALDAYDAKDFNKFDTLVDSINATQLMQQLDLAARREQCDWQPPFRQTGISTLLPHLSPLRGIVMYLRVRALHQIRQGKVTDALATLRDGYAMSDAVGREPVLVSALVSIGMFASLDDATAALMNRPDSPNLYWALADLPRRHPTFRTSFEGGRLGSATSTIPALARALAGQSLTPDEWRATLKEVANYVSITDKQPFSDPIKDASPDLLRAARDWYAKSRNLPPDQAANADPAAVLGPYYFHRYVIAYDDMYKLRPLPYPDLLPMSAEYARKVDAWRKEQPANPFLHGPPALDRAITTFARIDRSLAALTAVEALRAYAAAHDGHLPPRLQDVTDTPVPNNPYTDRPFDYRVDATNVATLSDTQSESHLTYTIRIRK
jgi:hypothetical protein